MTSRDFCFWLQGFFEISETYDITSDQAKVIRKHLDLVFVHEIDPSMGDKQEQAKLNYLHHGTDPNIKMRCYNEISF